MTFLTLSWLGGKPLLNKLLSPFFQTLINLGRLRQNSKPKPDHKKALLRNLRFSVISLAAHIGPDEAAMEVSAWLAALKFDTPYRQTALELHQERMINEVRPNSLPST